jgi:hydrogenase maturation protein HypF
MNRIQIGIAGIVQGVGFRPFIYRLAQFYNLGGWVLNDGDGVLIEAEGNKEQLTAFVEQLSLQAPPLAVIERLKTTTIKPLGETDFSILPSNPILSGAVITPDIAICPECRREISERGNRRFGYAFTNCTNCGPRFTIITATPYDRARTTMSQFSMCPGCQAEYEDKSDRRFHAQPNACKVCGPAYRLLDRHGQVIAGDPVAQTRRAIRAGAIAAVKGIGGYHLVCDAKQSGAVAKLRARKCRQDKPFAVMGGSMDTIRQYCEVFLGEEIILQGPVQPIVLLNKKADCKLPEAVAPRNACLGVMMPYAPIHCLLFEADDIWIMTSGNIAGEPLICDDKDALDRLAAIADCFLVHNRVIHQAIDDSVVRIYEGAQQVIRRGRGLAPAPIGMNLTGPCVLACGGQQKNTFCLTREGQAFVSAHIGDLDSAAALDGYHNAIGNLQRLLNIKPEFAACDLHPGYAPTQYAKSLNLPLTFIQHHHAHAASVMAENMVDEDVIAVVFDGSGFGTDGNLWGGEFFVANSQTFWRQAHFSYMALPGADMAIREPWRPAVKLLYDLYGANFVNKNIPLRSKLPDGWDIALSAANQLLNTPLSSSVGRIFDVAAAIIGIATHTTYEGQAAIELERYASLNGKVLPYNLKTGPMVEVDLRPAFQAMVSALGNGAGVGELASAFHSTIAAATVTVVRYIAKSTGIKKVALSGGVFQNAVLSRQVVPELRKYYDVLLNRQVPPNDGGLALGQAFVALGRIKHNVFSSTGPYC